MKNKINNNQGSVLIFIIVIAAIGATILLGLSIFVSSQDKNSRRVKAEEQAFGAAEEGIYWYRWYLAHMIEGKTAREVDEFWTSGNPIGVAEPYEVEVKDPSGGALGKYKLEITLPPTGSTIITAKSTGWTNKQPNVKRVIQVRFRKPAWCEYVVLSESDIRFGAGTEVYGMVHSNGGVQFDGVAHHLVTAFPKQYWSDDNDVKGWHPGVWTNNPPESERFLAGTKFPAAEKNFNSVIANLNLAKDYSQPGEGGLYLGQDKVDQEYCDWVQRGRRRVWECWTENKKVRGYHIIFNPVAGEGNDTISVSMVTEYGFNSYKIEEETPAVTYDVPDNGLVFVENHVWVEGTINNEHLTIVAADLTEAPGDPEPPGHDKDIYINNDMLYTNKDGRDILGLLAQDNVTVGLYSENNLEIDAAVLARRGRVGRDYYNSNEPTYYKRSTITVFGAIITNGRYGFSWVNNSGQWVSGYQTRNITFDNNLLYYPPPFFPTGDKYQIDLWEEL
jgi:type II secretory pathway pseudopilin PulG